MGINRTDKCIETDEMWPLKEKRKFSRLNAHNLIKYRVVGSSAVISFARNISAGGLLFNAKEDLPAGTMLEVWLNFPEFGQPIRTLGRVVRAVQLKKIGGYDIGMEIVEIEDKAREFIDNTVHKK